MTPSSYGNLPKITVIMVMRNAERCIARALDSLRMQHYPKLEVIAWDGLSTDGTPEMLARYPELITRLVREQDSGPPDAYNRAIELATGDFIGYLNADDEYEPGMLWAVAEAVLRSPDAEVVSTGILYYTIGRDGRKRVTGYYAGADQLKLTLENVLSELPTFMLSRFLKRETALKIGPYNTNRDLWYISTDREWMARLALERCRDVVVPHALYGFEMHAESISSNPQSFTRIIEEHRMIAEHLLARADLTEPQRCTVKHWQKRQLAFGFWKALSQGRFAALKSFFRQGNALAGRLFLPSAIALLVERMAKKLGLMLCGGIDRG